MTDTIFSMTQFESIALAVEIDHILAIYADISAEHEQIRNHWLQSINSVKLDNSIPTSNSVDEKFSLLSLKEMIELAHSLLGCHDLVDSKRLEVPAGFVKITNQLALLSKQTRSNMATAKVELGNIKGTKKRYKFYLKI